MQVYSENRKAGYDYEILEKYEAGMVLAGQEVKSIRSGNMHLTASYVVIHGSRVELVGAKVPAYQPNNAPADYNPERPRRLLLNKKELDALAGKAKERGFSLIPLKVYDNNGRIKLEFALAKGKKAFNKKEKIKKRDIERDTRRQLAQ